MAIDTSVPLTPKALGDHLWESENRTRNKISNPKDYVLALLFFKRACDRHAEETAAALDDRAEIPDATAIVEANSDAYHDLLIPDGCFWSDVRNTDEDRLGQAVNDALLGISNANPEQLHGVFEAIDFNNKRAIPPEALGDLLDHFEALGPLTDERCPADLGQAYEWTIAKFAAASGKRGGEFYMPAQVGKLGARLVAPEPGQDFYDPTCGSGGLLLQVLAEARRLHGGRARQITLFGQELTPETWAMARMNMLLHGAGGAATIVQGDTLAAPAFLEGAQLRRFDPVIANPRSPRRTGATSASRRRVIRSGASATCQRRATGKWPSCSTWSPPWPMAGGWRSSRWYRREARRRLLTTVHLEAARLGLDYGVVAVRDQRTRWGSCSRAANLAFNWRLVIAPDDVLRYVVVHELCHLRVRNHSKEFWRLLDEAMPDWREQAAWLREYGHELRAYKPETALS